MIQVRMALRPSLPLRSEGGELHTGEQEEHTQAEFPDQVDGLTVGGEFQSVGTDEDAEHDEEHHRRELLGGGEGQDRGQQSCGRDPRKGDERVGHGDQRKRPDPRTGEVRGSRGGVVVGGGVPGESETSGRPEPRRPHR